MDFTSWLQFFGITPQQLVPLLLVSSIGGYLFWRNYLKDLKNEVTDLHNATIEIQAYIKGDDKKWEPLHMLDRKPLYAAYGENHSPTLPNEKGSQLLDDSGFTNSYSALRQQIFALMDSKNPRTLYDYEVAAEKSLRELQNNPAMDSVKNYAVNHLEEPLDLIFKVASWKIRDDYEEYKKQQPQQ